MPVDSDAVTVAGFGEIANINPILQNKGIMKELEFYSIFKADHAGLNFRAIGHFLFHFIKKKNFLRDKIELSYK